MKSKMKRQRQTELPRFIVGALATAGASVANGATVQISFANNVVSRTNGTNDFVGDLTGDGAPDVTGYGGWKTSFGGAVAYVKGMGVKVATATANWGSVKIGGGNWVKGESGGLAAITFTDMRINNGAVTSGFVDVTAGFPGGDPTVYLKRLIFDDSNVNAPTGLTSASTGIPAWTAVPEPSSLGLLALGAGGLLARRRRAA
jgi:hypothetical protein